MPGSDRGEHPQTDPFGEGLVPLGKLLSEYLLHYAFPEMEWVGPPYPPFSPTVRATAKGSVYGVVLFDGLSGMK